MSERKNRMIAGAIGGMAGGAAMALALTAVRQVGMSRALKSSRAKRGLRQMLFTRTAPPPRADSAGIIGKRVLTSALLGGVYGGLRSGLNLPRLAFGPVFGIATYGLEQFGLAPDVGQTLGPWNRNGMALVPRLVTHAVYGTVTDLVSERVQSALA